MSWRCEKVPDSISNVLEKEKLATGDFGNGSRAENHRLIQIISGELNEFLS